jgi:hypothetical protein
VAKFQKKVAHERFTFTPTRERNGHGALILPENAKGGQFGFGLLMQVDDEKRCVVDADELLTAFLETGIGNSRTFVVPSKTMSPVCFRFHRGVSYQLTQFPKQL